jgi:hypothetical protein
MALSDTFFRIASLEEADRRSKILEQDRLDDEEERKRKAAIQQVAVKKMMAADLVRRAKASGLEGPDLQNKLLEMLPAYQSVYSKIGGDLGFTSPDEILAAGGTDPAEEEARAEMMKKQAEYSVRSQYGDTPRDKFKIGALEAQRGNLPQGYRFGRGGGAERIPGLDTPEQELDRQMRLEQAKLQSQLTEKAAPTYSDLHPQAKQLDNSKLFEQRKQYGDLMSTIDTAIADAEEAYKLQQGTDRTGPILGGGGILTQLNKALPGGDNVQRLEKAYNRQAASALAAFKALGMAGQLSDKEGEWVRSTEAQLSNDKDVNLETLSRGIALLKDRKGRISQLGSEFGLGDTAGARMQPGAGRKPLPPGFTELPDGRVRGPDGRTYRYAQ